MAKKSARSKGYRKVRNEKQPYLSKKEIIALVAIVAAIALVVFLINNFYDDGSLKLRGGVIQAQGENSITYNAGNEKNPKYFKVGEVHEIEGYTLEGTVLGSDENWRNYTLTPEDGRVDSVKFSASAQEHEALANYMKAYMTGNMQSYWEDGEVSDVLTKENGEHPVAYYITSWTTHPDETSAAAAATAEAAGDSAEAADDTAEAADDTTEAADDAAEAAGDTAEAADDSAETADDTAEAAGEAAEAAGDTAEATGETVEAAEEEPAAALYHQELSAYVSNGEKRTVCIHIIKESEDRTVLLEQSALEAVLDDALSALTYEIK